MDNECRVLPFISNLIGLRWVEQIFVLLLRYSLQIRLASFLLLGQFIRSIRVKIILEQQPCEQSVQQIENPKLFFDVVLPKLGQGVC